MKLKNMKVRHCDLNLVSHGTCSYICMCINAVANSVMFQSYDIIFVNIIFKHKLYIASGSVSPPPPPHTHKEKFWVRTCVDHSPPSSADVKYEYKSNCASPSHLCLQLACYGATFTFSFIQYKEGMVKVKFSLERAMKAQRGSRGIGLLFL
jgi:hypothetical protein